MKGSKQNSQSGDQRDQKEKVESIDPKQALSECFERLTADELYLKEQSNKIYELKLEITNPKFVEINHIRQTYRYYLIPALERAQQEETENQEQFIKWHPFLFESDKMDQFLSHFHSIDKTKSGEWEFVPQDPYQRDAKILFDLYKVKRQLAGIDQFSRLMKKSNIDFPSIFSKKKQTEILSSFKIILLMAFQQSLRVAWRRELFRNISLDLIQEERITSRCMEELLYSTPDSPEGCSYRRIFFQILLRNRVVTVINKKQTEVNYSLEAYEQLIHEFFEFFVDKNYFKNEMRQLIHCFYIQGKSLSESILDFPDSESLFLEEINEIKTFV